MPKRNTNPFKTVVENISTIHGTAHLTERNSNTRLIWGLLMIANIALTICFGMIMKNKFNEDQIITQINANCKVSEVPFPAVSICNFNVISLKETKYIERLLLSYNRNQSEINNFFRDLVYLKNYGVNSTHTGHYKHIMRLLKHHYFTIDTIMEDLHQKCENLLLYCSFNRKQKNCNDIFGLIKTSHGYCCAFNYVALHDGIDDNLLLNDENLEYYKDRSDDKLPSYRIVATSESGRTSGLHVVFNVEPEDYPSYATVPYFGANVLLSDPNDYPETTVLYDFIAPGESLDMKLEPLVFQPDPWIRSMEISKRACWFHDEIRLEHADNYSFETCTTECMMRMLIQTCGCVPYKYPKLKTHRVCEFEDLNCLHNVTIYKPLKPTECMPKCYMECSDKKYKLKSNTVPFLLETVPANVLVGQNVNQLTSLRVFFGRPTCNCYISHFLIDINYMIGLFGGVLSLSFGGSVLSVIELTCLLISALFLLLWRVFMKCLRNYVHSKKNLK